MNTSSEENNLEIVKQEIIKEKEEEKKIIEEKEITAFAQKTNQNINIAIDNKFMKIDEEQNESFDSEQELIYKINKSKKAMSTKASPNTNLLEPRKRNKIFERFTVSPVMKSIKNRNLMERKKKNFKIKS